MDTAKRYRSFHANPDLSFDPIQDTERWRKEYLKVVPATSDGRQHRNAARPVESNRRSNHRHSFEEGASIFAHMGPRSFQIINISAGGAAFYSDVVFERGTKLLLSAMGMIALDVEVLNCEMEEIDAHMMEYRYLVRVVFSPRTNGFQAYVLAREMYLEKQVNAAGAIEPT